MNAIPKITARAIRRPRYVHRELLGVDQDTWVRINLQAITDWYRTLPTTVSNEFDETEFRCFCASQYDLEWAEKERFEREFGSNYDREERYR